MGLSDAVTASFTAAEWIYGKCTLPHGILLLRPVHYSPVTVCRINTTPSWWSVPCLLFHSCLPSPSHKHPAHSNLTVLLQLAGRMCGSQNELYRSSSLCQEFPYSTLHSANTVILRDSIQADITLKGLSWNRYLGNIPFCVFPWHPMHALNTELFALYIVSLNLLNAGLIYLPFTYAKNSKYFLFHSWTKFLLGKCSVEMSTRQNSWTNSTKQPSWNGVVKDEGEGLTWSYRFPGLGTSPPSHRLPEPYSPPLPPSSPILSSNPQTIAYIQAHSGFLWLKLFHGQWSVNYGVNCCICEKFLEEDY